MENLEKISQIDSNISEKNSEKRTSSVVPKINESYSGLELVEERTYQGGTSIMYWM